MREKSYRDLKNITPGFFGYSVLRSGVHADFYHELLELANKMDFEIEGLHTETGPGVLEAAIRVDDALKAADKAALFKTFTKILAQRRGWMATFMAKWSRDWPGQSGHLHASLRDIKTGKGAFYDANAQHNMSETMRWFVGGQQQLMPEILAMVACTVNSYTRLIPGFWAPTDSAWGVENRTTALRVIPGSEKSQRVEYRVAAADINPVYRACRRHRLGPVGHREPGRSGRADRGQCLCGRASEGAGPAALARRGGRAAERRRRPRASSSATPSLTITPQRANGRSARPARPSPIGSSPATSRSSKRPLRHTRGEDYDP